MNPRFRRLLKYLLAAVALVLVTPHPILAQNDLQIIVAGPPNEGFKDVYYGVQAGIFKKYGLDVQPRIVHGGAVVLAGLSGGSYSVAYTNLLPVLQAHTHGLPFQIIAPSTVFVAPDHAQNAMLVAKDSPLKTARDLNGKTIGTQSLQDLNSVAMKAWIDKNGGDSSTVKIIEVPSETTVSALTSHRIDAMSLSEPLLTEALDTGKVRVFAKPQVAIATRFQSQAFVATSDFISQHQDAMEKFARAMHESAVYNNAHMKQTIPMISAFTAVPASVIARTVRSLDGDYVTPASIQPLIDFAAKYGMIPKAFRAEDIISPAALKAPR